jgi:hypothetical protein
MPAQCTSVVTVISPSDCQVLQPLLLLLLLSLQVMDKVSMAVA